MKGRLLARLKRRWGKAKGIRRGELGAGVPFGCSFMQSAWITEIAKTFDAVGT